jgi:GNAT superfamily N-acetyltransferase
MTEPVVDPMGEGFLLWRCLHQGPLSPRNIDIPLPNPEVDWAFVRARNIPLLEKLTRTYGACAILAREGDLVVGSLRFYPKALCSFGESGAGFCLQQRYPYGPEKESVKRDFLPLRELADKTLFVHCMMVAAPAADPGRYRRRGLASRMVRELIRWAGETGWHAIEATAYQELPTLYSISGVAGRRFWEPPGFRVIRKDREPGIQGATLEALRTEAAAAGVTPDEVTNRYAMRLEL